MRACGKHVALVGLWTTLRAAPVARTLAATQGDTMSTRLPTSAEIVARFQADYPTVQYHLVQFFTEHAIDAMRTFGGDFDQVIILAVLGQSHINAFLAAQQDPNSPVRGAANATRIADVTGLPRETVRRKLAKLEARGWVHQNQAREWELSGPPDDTVARRDLAALDARGLARLAHLQAALEKIA
jgi:DNA-binding MarR family transcriptional regulator